jgi:glycosyltransferase involved in cell wall biosynthesis
MKVEIISFTGNSGLTDYAISLARAMAAHVDTCVVSATSLPTFFDSMGFRIHRVFRRSRHYPIDIFRFIRGVLIRKPDWILLQGPLKVPMLDGLFVRFLRLCGVKTAITVHDVLPHYPKAWSAVEYGFYYRSFDKAIAHSLAASIALKKMGIAADILVVPHGSYGLFNLTGIGKKEARRKIPGIEDRDFVVLFFGTLEPRKGFMEFLDMAQAASGTANLKFLIAGGNSLAVHGKNFVSRFDASRSLQNLVVHDHRIAFEDVENYFSACDVVALPYLEGTTSGVLKLALAFGKPVIATMVGDFPEQVPTGGGILVPTDASIPEKFLEAINTIQGNYQAYASAMESEQEKADWRGITRKVILHLSH